MNDSLSNYAVDVERSFRLFAARMAAAGLDPLVIQTFRHYYEQLFQGGTGLIGEGDLQPVEDLPDAEHLSSAAAGREVLGRSVIIKLNGGLGTSMGLNKAKSLLVARDGLTFLDIIVQQTLKLRERTGAAAPLLFMNSFNTREDTLAALRRYPQLDGGLPIDFVQNKTPKVLQAGLTPVEDETGLAWCPPGHGDLYVSLQTSGVLDKLLERGFEYAFVSNADNLGAVLDETILGYFAERNYPFLMEVADRTPADSKGGHLARRNDGRLLLREVAQCPPEAADRFADINHYRYFNTNNIWLRLSSLREALEANEGILKLPLIRNSKTLDPRNPNSPAVFQLETAMGAAIELFDAAAALRVPRTRFAPVKLCSDLLVLRSDACVLTEDRRIIPNPENRYGLPLVKLDAAYYRFIDDLARRFPDGAPSLRDCESLTVEGDVRFGGGIVIRGRTRIVNAGPRQAAVAAGRAIEGDLRLDGSEAPSEA